MTHRRTSIGLLVLILTLASASAQPSINPAGIEGALLVCGRGEVSPAAYQRFIDLAGGDKAKIVIVATDKAATVPAALVPSAKKKEVHEVRVVHPADAKEALRTATGAWFMIESSQWRNPAGLIEDCRALIKRGGVVGAEGPEAVLVPQIFDLLPGGIVETDAGDARMIVEAIPPDRIKPKARPIVFLIEPKCALLLQGRTLSVIGEGSTDIYLAKSKMLPVRTIKLQGKAQEDLTALRRAARDRAEAFPPAKPKPPVLDKGTLVIVGGGGMPKGLYAKFVEYAGGPDKAHIVIFPTAAPDPLPKRDSLADTFKKAGAKKVTILYGKTQREVLSKEFLNTLKEATGLWFDGGRQWRFVDCYEGTQALPLMFDVLKRGGVIGGTSAGATIQGDYLARGGVFNNFDIRYEGYERGLAFLKGVAIDQHFTQRKRHADMTQLMKVYPQYLGIGIDEATALVVQGQIADVIGKGKAHFYDTNRKIEKGQPDYEAISAGGRYDLKERKVLAGEK